MLVNNFFLMKCRLKVKEDVIAELHGNVIKKDEEIANLKSLLDEQKNKNNVSDHFWSVFQCRTDHQDHQRKCYQKLIKYLYSPYCSLYISFGTD